MGAINALCWWYCSFRHSHSANEDSEAKLPNLLLFMLSLEGPQGGCLKPVWLSPSLALYSFLICFVYSHCLCVFGSWGGGLQHIHLFLHIYCLEIRKMESRPCSFYNYCAIIVLSEVCWNTRTFPGANCGQATLYNLKKERKKKYSCSRHRWLNLQKGGKQAWVLVFCVYKSLWKLYNTALSVCRMEHPVCGHRLLHHHSWCHRWCLGHYMLL